MQRSSDSDGGITYRPEVTYHYTVDGREHLASRTRFGDRFGISFSAPAVRTVRRYPVGSSVTVRYNPEDPAEAVLEPGLNGFVLGSAALAFLFVAIAIWMLKPMR